MRFKFLLVLFIFKFFFGDYLAQDNHEDSLITLVKKSPNDSIRVNHLIKLGRFYYKKDWQKADSTYRIALSISQKRGNKYGEALSYEKLGMATRKLGDYPLGIEYLKKANSINEELKDSIGMSICNNNIGVLYDELGDYENALYFYIKSNDLDRALGDLKGAASSLNNIALIYSYLKNYDKSIEVLKESIEIKEQVGDEISKAYSYLNLANMYTMKEQQNLAIEYYNKAVEIYLKYEEPAGLAKCYNNLGFLYKHKDSEIALNYYKEALKIREELGDKLEIAKSKHSIGEVYMLTDRKEEALVMIQEAAKLSEEVGGVDILASIYGSLHSLYFEVYNYERAYEYALKYMSMHDSLLDGDKFSAISELQTKYETDKNKYEKELAESKRLQAEEEAKRLEAVSERKSTLLYAAVVGFILIGGLVVVVYRSNRQRKKANEELQSMNDIIKAKNKDITSSIEYAKHIQDSILPSDETIKKLLPKSFVLFEPRDIVSGDFYWFYKHGNKTLFAAADCTGHGVPGALVSMVCSNAINHVVVQEGEISPEKILTKLNQEILERLRKEGSIHQAVDGMDIALCCIEEVQDKTVLHYSGAMNSLYLLKGEEIEEIRADRQAIGGRTPVDYQFEKHTLQLDKGNRIFVFSDGMIDQFGGVKGKKLLAKRFKQYLEQYNNEPIEAIKEKLGKDLINWQGDFNRIDDVLVIGIEV